jgi:hypothetical protein
MVVTLGSADVTFAMSSTSCFGAPLGTSTFIATRRPLPCSVTAVALPRRVWRMSRMALAGPAGLTTG